MTAAEQAPAVGDLGGNAVSDLIDTTEMYLKTVYELTEEGITPLRARIAERLGHSGPTVSQTVARMERDGLVVVTGDRHLELTDLGLAKAVRVMRTINVDPGYPPIAMVQEIDYPSLEAVQEALDSPVRLEGRTITDEMMEMFDGRFYHVVYERIAPQ